MNDNALGRLIAAGLFIAVVSTAPDPGDSPASSPDRPAAKPAAPTDPAAARLVWTAFPKQRDRAGKTPFHADILSHLPARYGNQYDVGDRCTSGHETTHGINAHLRNTLCKRGEVAFYVGDDKAALMPQPKLTLAQIGAAIPAACRGMRYQLYFVQQARQWNDTPLYCFDEWVAYTNEGRIALEWTDRKDVTDAAVAQMEFAVYAVFAAVAIDKHDPGYFEADGGKQFTAYLAHELRRATDQWRAGQAYRCYRWASPLPAAVRADGTARAMVRKLYGEALTLERLFAEPAPLGSCWFIGRRPGERALQLPAVDRLDGFHQRDLGLRGARAIAHADDHATVRPAPGRRDGHGLVDDQGLAEEVARDVFDLGEAEIDQPSGMQLAEMK